MGKSFVNLGAVISPIKIIAVAIALLFLAIYFSYMQILRPEVAYMDTLRFLNYFDLSEAGHKSLFATWNQQEHRGLTPQFLVYMNSKYFGFNIYLAALLSGPVIAATGIAICYEYGRAVKNNDKTYAFHVALFAAFLFFLLFSLSNWELYSLDIGATLFFRNLAFVLYWIGLGRMLAAEKPSRWIMLFLLMSAPLIIIFVGFGWSYSFTITSILCILIFSRKWSYDKYITFILISLIAGISLYIIGGFLINSDRVSVFAHGKTPSWENAFISIFDALFSAFVGSETSQSLGLPGWLKFFAATTLLCAGIWLAMQSVAKRKLISILPFAFVVYSGLHILSLAYARGRYDPIMAAAPRYYLDVSLFVLGTVWLLVYSLKNDALGKRERYTKIFLLIFICSSFIFGQAATWVQEWAKAPYRHAAFQQMEAITLFGMASRKDASLLQSQYEFAVKGIEIQRRYGIGPFRKIGCSRPGYGNGWYQDEGGSRWMGRNAEVLVRNCGNQLAIKAFVPRGWEERNALIRTSDGGVHIWRILPGEEVSVNIPINSNSAFISISISLDVVTVPANVIDSSGDNRSLGALFSTFSSSN